MADSDNVPQSQNQMGAGANADANKQKARQEQLEQQEEMKNAILAQILDQQARARLNTLKISKPEKAQLFENMVIQMAQTGRLLGKLDDAQFVDILQKINAEIQPLKSKVKYDRRRAAIDSDDDDYGC